MCSIKRRIFSILEYWIYLRYSVSFVTSVVLFRIDLENYHLFIRFLSIHNFAWAQIISLSNQWENKRIAINWNRIITVTQTIHRRRRRACLKLMNRFFENLQIVNHFAGQRIFQNIFIQAFHSSLKKWQSHICFTKNNNVSWPQFWEVYDVLLLVHVIALFSFDVRFVGVRIKTMAQTNGLVKFGWLMRLEYTVVFRLMASIIFSYGRVSRDSHSASQAGRQTSNNKDNNNNNKKNGMNILFHII